MSTPKFKPSIKMQEIHIPDAKVNKYNQVNSAFFEAHFVNLFLQIYSSYDYITINKTTLNNGDETLKMFISDNNGVHLTPSTEITAAFPCPEHCAVIPVSSNISGNYTFQLVHLENVLNQNLHITGLGFQSTNNGRFMAMYALELDRSPDYDHVLYDQMSTHEVYVAEQY